MCDKSYATSWPDLPPIKENGWNGGARTKEHSFTLCACLSLHTKLLLNLPNAAANQTAGGAVAFSRTEFLCKCFGKNCTNSFTDGTRVDDEEEDDDQEL